MHLINYRPALLNEKIRDYILALTGCCPLKFLHALQPLNCISSRTLGAGWPQVGLCPIFLVLVWSHSKLGIKAIENSRSGIPWEGITKIPGNFRFQNGNFFPC